MLYPDALPKVVCIDGVDYPIRYQYYIVLEIIKVLEDFDLSDIERIYVSLDLFYKKIPKDTQKALKAMELFIAKGSWTNGYQGKEENQNVLSFELDAPFIWASMKQTYPFWDWSQAHWWEFKAAFDSLPSTTKIKEIIQIRLQKIDSKMDKQTAKSIRELQKYYALPVKNIPARRKAVDIEAELMARAKGR
jgi:hypothetical protein